MSEPRNVAIACQGGGTHTAFTAGVLETVLERPDWEAEYELVGISGTSGGAFNALAAWYGLVTGGVEDAVALLNDVWTALAADDPADRMLNAGLLWLNRMEASGLPVPTVSPYQVPGQQLGKDRIREILEAHIDFDDIPTHCEETAPDLVVGTVNINAGVFETFRNERVTVDAVLASAAIPTLFEAVEIDGHYHWDGLFSQNPPVRDLMDQPPARKPDEIWVVQINPQELAGEPTRIDEIADRRNELAGNISLNQEIEFIEHVNEWVEDGTLSADEFRTTAVHRIEMDADLHSSTKLDRSREFITEMMDLGRDRATAFLDDR